MKKFLMVLLVAFFASCGFTKMKYSEYSYERIDLADGSHIMVIHNSNCPCHKNFFKPKSSKSSYIKKKYDIYCSVCWEADEIRQMNHYSKANIIRAIDWDMLQTSQDWENARFYSRIIDSTNRVKYVRYALKDGQLVDFNPALLPGDRGYASWEE